jgi:hypothetical protein
MATAETHQPFNARVIAGLIGAGIAAFAAFLLLAAYADDFRSGRDGRPHPLSVSAVGFAGLVELLDALGETPTLVRSESDHDTENLLVITIEPITDSGRLAALLLRRAAKPTLLILPKWETTENPLHKGWVSRVAPIFPGMSSKLLDDVAKIKIAQSTRKAPGLATGTDLLEGIRLPAPEFSQTISGKGATPLLRLGSGESLLAKLEGRPLYVLADPDIMSNHGLKDSRKARAAVDIMRQLNSTGAEGISFDLTLNGFAQKPNALKLLFEPPFLVLTLALFVAGLLAGLHGAFRFGPERQEERAIAFGKSALVENSAGLIRMAKREHRTGSAYADLIREAAAHDSAAPAAAAGAELDAYLDRLSRPGEPPFSALADRLRAARDRFELVAAAHALFMWKKDISQ